MARFIRLCTQKPTEDNLQLLDEPSEQAVNFKILEKTLIEL